MSGGRSRQEHSHVKAGERLVRAEGAILVGFDHSEVGQPLQKRQRPGVAGHVGEAADYHLGISPGDRRYGFLPGFDWFYA